MTYSGDRTEPERLEDLWRVVQDGIDTGELLEDHDPATNSESLQHVWGKQSPDGSRPALTLFQIRFCLLVEHDSGLDLEVLSSEKRIRFRKSS